MINGKITHASLFSGIGGFDLAAEWVGWYNAFHCEINLFCRKILRYHFLDSVSYEDITQTDFSKWKGKIDILTGGFPCQPFSLAGKRKGADDDRYLWPEMLRAVREIRPAWVIGENVAGIITMVLPGETVELGCQTSLFGEDYKDEEHRQQYVVETVCSDLEREGYSVQPFIIPACAVGAPHRRNRVWFVANRTDAGIEAVQRAGKNGVFPVGDATHSDRNGCRDGKNKQEPITGRKGTTDSENDGTYGAASNATGEQSKRVGFKSPENSTPEQRESGGICEPTDTIPIPDWECFPTQSPVCGRNDGLSSRLDGITFSKWREESVRAYGNAIVPQVAYEIFRAINQTIK